MQLKTTFTFTQTMARKIKRLTEYEARGGGTASTQAFLERLIDRAYQEMEAEQQAARRIRRCPMCNEVFSGGPSCPKCGQWVA